MIMIVNESMTSTPAAASVAPAASARRRQWHCHERTWTASAAADATAAANYFGIFGQYCAAAVAAGDRATGCGANTCCRVTERAERERRGGRVARRWLAPHARGPVVGEAGATTTRAARRPSCGTPMSAARCGPSSRARFLVLKARTCTCLRL